MPTLGGDLVQHYDVALNASEVEKYKGISLFWLLERLEKFIAFHAACNSIFENNTHFQALPLSTYPLPARMVLVNTVICPAANAQQNFGGFLKNCL